MEKERIFLNDVKKKYDLTDEKAVLEIYNLIIEKGYRFETKEGIDFDNQIYEKVQEIKKNRKTNQNIRISDKKKTTDYEKLDPDMKIEVKKQLRKMDFKRRLMLAICMSIACVCLVYTGIYFYQNDKTKEAMENLADMKQIVAVGTKSTIEKEEIFKEDNGEEKIVILQVLKKYETLYNENNDLIGWIKIDDTNIDYPVLKSNDSEEPDFYLRKDFYGEYDQNGSIYIDSECDVINRSDNIIIYGHHMKSGNMFGRLDRYSDYDYYLKHKYIQFDTIYEEGLYEVMYVFRSRIYNEDEIVFKYYQFIDANSAEEFDSCMEDMKNLSLYDTGITAGYGDQLLTLSTCDYQETNGRFVVVAVKIQ